MVAGNSVIMFYRLCGYEAKQRASVADALEGAWSLNYGGQDFAMLLEDGYCMFTQYNLKDKKFGLTAGGPLLPRMARSASKPNLTALISRK